jgi:hypothetical protein
VFVKGESASEQLEVAEFRSFHAFCVVKWREKLTIVSWEIFRKFRIKREGAS